MNAAKPMREITSAAAAAARLLFLESVARGEHRLGVADPHEIGLASPWAKPKEIGAAVWLGQSPWEDRYLRKMGPTIS